MAKNKPAASLPQPEMLYERNRPGGESRDERTDLATDHSGELTAARGLPVNDRNDAEAAHEH
jgi:hypothetical protein